MGKKLIVDYRLIRGLPHVVDEEVRALIDLETGWQPKGKLIKLFINGYEILVQRMVKYEG